MELVSLRKWRMTQKTCRRFENAEPGKLYSTTADGDFAIAPNISGAVAKVVATQSLAYTYQHQELTAAIKIWYQKKFQVDFKENQILFGSGVLYWIHVAVSAFTKVNEPVLIISPVYLPFGRLIKRMDRQLLTNELVYDQHHWKVNWADLEAKMQQVKLLVFCSPQNPTGTVWTKADLTKINNLALKYNCVILFDEIWQDIILKNPFTHSLALKNQSQIIHAGGVGKGFNLGALHYGHMICNNPLLFAKMQKAHLAAITYTTNQPWITAAVVSAYQDQQSDLWQQAYLAKIKANMALLNPTLKKYKWEYAYPEGTFMLFIKLGDQTYYGEKLVNKLYELGIKVTTGEQFSPRYQKWIRLNLAIDDYSIKQLITILKNYGKSQLLK